MTSPAISGLSISNVTGGASGSTSATLTLATASGFDFDVPATLAVRVLAAAHSGSTNVTTGGTVPLTPTDEAPSFGSGSVPAKTFFRNRAIAEFQVPAATGGNGALAYTASGLPAGLVFDADGTGSCPGTEPREVCGTPTAATGGARTVTVTAQDADANRAAGDRGTLTFQVTVFDSPTVASNPSTLTEANLDGARLTVTLPSGFTFASGVSASSFALATNPTIAGLSISNVTGGASGTRTATLTLATGAGYGFSRPSTLAVRVLAAAHSGSTDISSATLAVSPTPGVTLSRRSLDLEEDPTVGGGTNRNRGTYTVVMDSPLTGCFAVVVNVASDNADVTTNQSVATFSSTNWSTPQTFTVTAAHDGDSTHDTATLSHSIDSAVNCPGAGYTASLAIDSLTVNVNDDEAPRVAIASTSPASLAEANLHTATVAVALTNATFASDATASSFALLTDIRNVSVSQVSGGVMGTTSATLTLSFTGDSAFAAVETLAVRVPAAAHTGSDAIATGTVVVTPTPGIALSRTTLALEEDPTAGGGTNRNVGTYTVALTADPTIAVSGDCAVNLRATSNNGDVAVDTDSTPLTKLLAFDGTNWSTPQTVTVTAGQDADGVDDVATISFSRPSVCAGGFFGRPSLPSVTVNVNDDETPAATIASPTPLTAATLNNATLTVSLERTTYASGVTAASFTLVSGATGNLAIASATATDGGTSATLTLSYSGTLAADATLAVRVLAAAHAGDTDLTTGPTSVVVTDTAPTFGAASVANQYFPAGAAIAPFQVPAATGGNGAIDYSLAFNQGANPLPAGLKFDATGTDAGGCTASDFPPGTAATWATAPRTLCGTPTEAGQFPQVVLAHDADSNRDGDDRDSLAFVITVHGASIASTNPSTLTEGNLNTATVSVSLAHTTFGSGVTAASFELVTAIPNVSISGVSNVSSGDTTATLTLAFTGDFNATETLSVKVLDAAHSRSGDLTTGAVSVFPTGVTDTAPTFGSASVANQYFPAGAAIAPLQIPAATGGNGAIDYSLALNAQGANPLPTGLKFDATGTDAGGCTASDFPPGTAATWATAPRTLCGTPTETGQFPQVVLAHDADSNRDGDDRGSLVFVITVHGASIASTNPSTLTEGNLNTATVSVSLTHTTFGSGVTASSFELVTAIPNVSISGVSSVSSGDATATLTLAFTGDFNATETLAVRVIAAAHSRSGDLTTGAVSVFPTGVTDTAPTFGSASVANQYFPAGAAIAPLQIPAATGGNGAIDYSLALAQGANPLPAGLKFDATGTDPGGCTASDFPPGTAATWATAPRTLCGTPTETGQFAQVVLAHDADSNRDGDDRGSLVFVITVHGASIASTNPASLDEGNLNTATVSVSLTHTTFGSGVTASSFELVTAIPNVTVSTVSSVSSGDTTATLTLAFTGDFSATETLAVRVLDAAHSRSGDLTTGTVSVTPTDTTPTFTAAPAREFLPGVAIAPFQVAVTGGNGEVTYTVAGLPAGLKLDVSGTDAGGCTASDFPPGTAGSWATAPLTVCGTPTRNVVSIVVVSAEDEDGDTASVQFRVTVAGPAASIASTSPAALAEGSLNGATLTVSLARTDFAAGLSASRFALVTTIPDLRISGVAATGGGAVAVGATEAVLTLAFTGDFGGTRTLAVRVLAAAHSQSGDLTTGTVDVTATAGVTVGTESLALNEPPNAGTSGTYTVVLDAAPPSTCSLTIGVTGGNADVAASPGSLTFTDASWDTPQTVTVTASADADSSPDADTLAHSITASTCTGYPTSLAIGSVAVTVADADVGVTIAPGPAALTESNLHGATLTLTLDNTTFAAGAQAAGAGAFELVSTITGLTIAQVAGVTSGGTTATLTLGFTGDFRGQPTLAVRVPATTHQGTGALTSNAVAVTADAGVTVSESSLSLDEDPGTGGSAHEGTYTVVLDSPPTGCALVRIDVASDDAGVTVSPAMLTFRRTGAVQLWSAPQTVTATAGQDDDGADVAATVSHSVGLGCNAAGYILGMAIDGVSVAVDDDETPGILFDADPGMANDQSGPLALVEDDASDASKEYTVRLAAQPTQDVTVTLTSADPGAVAVGDTDGNTPGDQNTLTFTATNWATGQTVTLTAQGDDDGGNESVAVTHAAATASASEYTNVSAGLTANVTDDDTPALTLSATTLSVPEQGSATYTVRLATLPVGGPVTVAVTGAGDGITVDTDGATGGDQDTLTFTATNWATAQTVTVAAADDQDAASERVTLTHTATGADYGGVSADLEATAADDDAPQVALALSSSSIGESGGTSTVTATLDRQSSVAVTVTVAASPVSPAVAGDFMLSSANTLTFAANATASAGTVTVVAVGNTTDAPDKTVTVSGTASDSLGLAQDPSSVTLTITDDDAAPGVTLSLSDASIGESGGTSTVTAALSHPSSAATTVTVTAVSGAFTVPSGAAGAIVIPAGGTTAATDTVTITAVDNDVDAPDNPVTVTATVANDQGAGSVTGATLTLEDDEATPTVTLSVMPASVSENGGAATVRATLSGKSIQPTTVTVTEQTGVFTVAAGAGATIIVAAGQTTTTDTATITAVDNAVDAADNPVTVTGTPTNGHGVGAVTGASLTLTDDDVAAIVTSPVTTTTSRVRTSEDGSTAAVAVTLATEPTGDVRMDVASQDTAQGTVSPAMLTFTATNWSTAQTVTLTGVDDNPDAVDGSQTYTVSLTVDTANTADSNYDALSAVTIHAVNADDELGLDVGTVSGPVTEAGGTATFTVKLVTDPALVTQASQAVTVSVTSRDTGEGRVSPPSLTFTAGASGTWSTSQTVTVTGVDDDVDDGTVTWDVRLDTSSANGSDYDGVPDVDVSVTTTDDDAAPTVTLSVSPGTIAESGGTATVTAVLNRASSEATTLTVTGVTGLYTPGSDATIVIPAGATTSTDTATIAAVDDAVHQGSAGRAATVTATVANDRAAADATTMTVTGAALALTDDEAAPGATLSLNPATVAESGAGNTSAVSAVLTRASAVATTVTVTAVSGFYTVGSDATIVIPAGATTAASDTAAITAVDNATDEPDRMVTVTATLSNDRGAGSVTGATLTITDDDAAPTVALSVSPASISEDGGTAAVGAALSNPSSQPTTVTVTAQANVFTVASGAGATIIVAAGQTTTTDTATITAVDNAVDAADNVVTVTGTPTNSHGVGALTDVSLTITDDDVAGIVTSPQTSAMSRVRTSEDGSTATVAVTLATEPTGDVRMDVASSDTAQGTASPAMLTFTATNWNTAQTVTLTGVDDNPGTPDGSQNYTVSLTVDAANTADASYDALSAVTIHARNLDDEAGVEVSIASGTTLMTTEGGGTATFTVRLLSAPEGDVTVPLASSDPGEGTVSPSSLVFTAANATTAQTVVVTGVDDEVDDGDESYRIGTGDPSSPDDPAYDALEAGDVDDVDVVNADDDTTPTVTLALTPSTIDEDGTASTVATVSENGGVATVTATLSHPSDEATTVTVAATPVDPAVAGDFTLSTETTLTIAALATASTGTVTVAAVDNAVDAPDKTVTVSGTAANARASADSATMTVTAATLTIADDDERGLAFAGAGADPEDFEGVLDVAEGGEVAYTVALASAPVGTVSVAVAAGNPSLSVAPERLTFTAEDWNTPRTVTVAAQDDGDDYVNEASWVSHTASGGGYDEVSGVLPVSVAGETTVRVKAAAGTTTWVIEGRRVVVTVAAGVPEGIEVDFAGVGSGPAEAEPAMTVEGPAAVDAKVVARAADDGFNLGAEEVRTVVDVAVTDLAGVGLCLPVAAAVVAGLPEGDTGRLRLLRYDEDTWGVVGEEYRPAAEMAPGRVCAGGVDSFSPFASGYVDTKPEFDAAGFPKEYVWNVDEPVAPETLPLATGGDCADGDCRGGEGLDYRLAPETLPPGLAFDQDGSGECGRARTLCGTPTEEFAEKPYTWTAADVDGHRDTLGFTIEVKSTRDKARARLKRINESILPEVSRASWDSAMAAVAGRLESAAGGGASGASGGGLAAALAGFVQANEQALEDDASWKETLSGQSFAVALGGGEGEGAGPGTDLGRSVVVWGAGDRRHLSRDEPWLGWSGDLSAFHLGADAAFGAGLTGGLGVSWFESRMDYVDRSDDEPIEGVHRSRMASVQPYVGWSSGEGARLWASLGYGSGEIEIEDQALMERYGRQRSGSRLLAAAAGGAVRLTPVGAVRVELKGEGQATRYAVDDNGDGRDDLIEGLAVETHRLRVAVQGSREYVLAGGGRVTPSAELGVRWDGGDGATGAGGEVGGGVSWTGPGRLVLEAGGRWLVAHRSGVEEWGLTGGLRLAPRANGRGLSLSVSPGWGEAGSGVSRLWEEGMAGRGETAEAGSGVGVEAEVGYGVGAFGGFGVATPYTRFGQAREERRYGLGWRLDRRPGDGFALDLGVWRREHTTERAEQGVGLDLRLRW